MIIPPDNPTGRMPDGDIGGSYTDAGAGLSGWFLALARAPFTEREYRVMTALLSLMHPIKIGSWYDITAADLARITGLHNTKARLAVRGLVNKGVVLRAHDSGNRGAIALCDPKSWFFLPAGGPVRSGPDESEGPDRSASEGPDRSASKGGRGDNNNIYINNKNNNKNIYLYNTTTTTSGGNDCASSGGGGGDWDKSKLVLPNGLRPYERVWIGNQVSKLVLESAQEVVDVLAAEMRQKQIRSPVAYVSGLLKRLREGTFDRSTGLDVRRQREQPIGDDQPARPRGHPVIEKTTRQVLLDQAKQMNLTPEQTEQWLQKHLSTTR